MTEASPDPVRAWQEAVSGPWSLKWAGHLLRRAAFGLPPASFYAGTSWQRLQHAFDQGRDASVQSLVSGQADQEAFEQLMGQMGDHIARRSTTGSNTDRLRGWWLYRMVHTPHPLRERMTLFWHDHFATSVAKVRQLSYMRRQNDLLRQHALGSFRKLLDEISRDPAMMIWLDSNSNIKGRPNENYARELLELFTLGEGQYTETDVQETARAFTGWRVIDGEFRFDADRHDDGIKTILGQTGRWDGDDVIRIVLEQPAASRLLARKFYRQFISEAEEPADELLEPLAEQLRKSDYDIGQCVETILKSEIFFSSRAYRRRIKSPVDYVVGLVQALDSSPAVTDLASAMADLGQSLFEPPTVEGWEGGKAWLNSATLIARHNLAWKLINGDAPFEQALDPKPMMGSRDQPIQQVELLVEVLLQDKLDEETMQRILDSASKGSAAGEFEERFRQWAHAIAVLPEYQLS